MKTRRFTLYCHTNRVNGKHYIGQTIDTMEERWKEHLYAAKVRQGSPALGAAIRKYGADAFDHQVLEVVSTKADANEAEARWVKQLNCRVPYGYNITAGGDGPDFIHEDTKRRIGEASRARLQAMTPEQRAAYFATNIHVWTPERKVRQAARAKSTTVREKVSSSQKKFWSNLSPEERSERVKHQLAGMSVAQKGNRTRKAWTKLTPEARAERVQRAQAGISEAARAGQSEKMRAWQTEQAQLRTPEQRSEIVKKSWATRRARYGQTGARVPEELVVFVRHWIKRGHSVESVAAAFNVSGSEIERVAA